LRITALSLRNIRSYERFEAQLSGRSVVITGPNGAGKTNLLEALTLFGPGRTLRRARLPDVVRHGATEAAGAGLTLSDPQREDERCLRVNIQGPRFDKRELRIDGEPVRKARHLSDLLRFLWLTPAMDRLFVDAPGERRRFLDRIAAAGAASHAEHAARYEQAMRQRMAALEQNAQPAVLDALEQEMTAAGLRIAQTRRETAESLEEGYEALRQEAFPRASLFIEGEVDLLLANEGADAAAKTMTGRLRSLRRADRDAKRTLFGPHRSDLVATHLGKAMPARLCSTGEQKALLIGLILARAAAAQGRGEGALVLLLDEIAAHLDQTRRDALAQTLEELGLQAFLTGTDEAAFSAFLPHMDHLKPAEMEAS
jgi:DNA replication and repair protein RecF